MPAPATDLLIVGAGPVGCALALALRGAPLRIALLERDPAFRPAFRPLALSYASRLILERAGAWRELSATPIDTVHASQQGGFGCTRMGASECGVPALGYVVDYALLHSALRSRVDALVNEGQVSIVREPQVANCVVHAEGLSADATEKPYGQAAVVCLVRTEPPASGTAFERFTPEGPLALLPFEGRYAVVWSARPERAARLLDASEDAFCRELAAAAGSRIGAPVAVEGRSVQPLALRVRAARVGEREVYIGNAAQTLHPVAGQGLNLGLRDAWDLAQILRRSTDPGDPAALARYAASRRFDALATIRITDALASAFLGAGGAARIARGLALTALDVLPAPRRFFARRMIYGPSALP